MKCKIRNLLLLLLIVAISCVLTILICHTDTTQVTSTSTGRSIRLDGEQTLEGDKLSRNNPLSKRFPRIFIIGFGKAGTRMLYDVLLMHSKVIGPYKEMRFFDERYHLGINWYVSQMPGPTGEQNVAEKSPCYVLTPQVPMRLIKTAKLYNVNIEELKFVVIFRHPIVRAISEYLEWQSTRAQHHGKLLARFDDLAVDKYGLVNSDFQPLNHSLYAHYIKIWLQHFNPNQFCYINGEMFHEKPHNVIGKLEKCLKLPHEISKDNFVLEEKRQLYCLTQNGTVICPPLSKGRPHPFVQQDVVDILMNYFKPFNEELYTITGENYNWENNYVGLNIL